MNKHYFYTFSHHKDEYELCRMEMRSFFGHDTDANYLKSSIAIDPSRSPFIVERLEVLFEGEQLSDIVNELQKVSFSSETYRVDCLNHMDLGETEKIPHSKRRAMEREIALAIEGEPALTNPVILYGILFLNGQWYFGKLEKSISIWRDHVHKPNSYSTALNTRVARAIVNIAVPFPENLKVIDPCCGIGTVVIEALSMGVDIVGRDIKPLVCKGARENIAYFDLNGTITKGPISEVTEHYDVALIDLPYNIYTHISRDEQFDIIQHGRRIADHVLIVTIETIDDLIEKAGLTIVDRCIAKKHLFERQILLCN